jgi:hypothetical protein
VRGETERAAAVHHRDRWGGHSLHRRQVAAPERARSWVEKTYPHVIYFHEAGKGGHFAAWEEPQLFSEEIRAGFRPLRLRLLPTSGYGKQVWRDSVDRGTGLAGVHGDG